MKRLGKRLWSALLACVLAMTLLPAQVLAEGTQIGSTGVNYEFSDDYTTVTFSGSGVIDVAELNTKEDFKKNKESVKTIVIEAGVTGISDCISSNNFISDNNGNITINIEGTGDFRFGNKVFERYEDGQITVTSERTNIEVGNSAFNFAKLAAFPMEQVRAIGSSGFTGVNLPINDTTLRLHLKGTEELNVAATPTLGITALGNIKNSSGDRFTAAEFTIEDVVVIGTVTGNSGTVFGTNSSDKLEQVTFKLEENATLIFGGGVGLCSATTLKFTGNGHVYFQYPDLDGSLQIPGEALGQSQQLQSMDFSEFSGEIQFAKNMFAVGFQDNTTFTRITLGDDCEITNIPEKAFAGCSKLIEFDFTKVTGYIGAEAFAGTNLKSVDLSNVTYIGADAFEDMPDDVTGWDTIDTAITNGTLKKLEYNEVFQDNELVKAFVLGLMEGEFSLTYDGEEYEELKPSDLQDAEWEDSHTGTSNSTDPGSTQITKSADGRMRTKSRRR